MIHHSPRRSQGWIWRSDLLIEVCRGVAWGGSKCKVDKSLHSWGWMLGLGLVSLVCILTPELTVLAWYVTGGLTSLSSASNSWSPHQLPPPPTLPPPPPPTALTAGNALRVINILSLANCPCQWSRNYIVCHRKQYSDIWLGPSVKWSSWKAFKILISFSCVCSTWSLIFLIRNHYTNYQKINTVNCINRNVVIVPTEEPFLFL